jgi:flavin reductase (DIM6/NTAB) family NADH-FMN oxidoreductase RutF
MDFDFDTLARPSRYKLLTSLVVPRPIALVTTVGAGGIVNAAPFSFFNVLADEPPIVIISVEDRTGGPMKDTARNIVERKEFVVNLVDEGIAVQMHGCSNDLPPEVSELDAVGLTAAPSVAVAPPRIQEAPAALECTLHSDISIDRRRILIGLVRHLHVRDGLVDPDSLRIDMSRYQPVGRLFANHYCHTGDRFTLQKNAYLDQMEQEGRA